MPLPAPHLVQPPSPAETNACLLAFDSATEMLAVALQKGERVWAHDGPGGAVASARLIPEIRALLDTAGLALSDLDAIAFGAGPGAFTGLRTACSVAQGLAFGASLPVLAIDSLMVVAEAAREEATATADGGPIEVHVAMDARMDQIYAAAYRWVDGHWQSLMPPALHTLASLHASWRDRPPRLVAGSAAGA
ncbi:MAG: tRNA (adenosine(37)-N6)-threonylcarbamoyltransferase complex dimerization subunit type 1 TsaB, partial [Rubrivivax sp.]